MKTFFFLFLLVSTVYADIEVAKKNTEPDESPKLLNVLAFGGNGMIGSEVLDRLIKTGKYNITTVHRGSKKFDSGERIDPHVNVVPCNRHKKIVCDDQEKCEFNALKYCPKLMGVLESTPKIDVVLDFSGYEVKWVHDAIHALNSTTEVGVYIYISTDSVYEVAEAKSSRRPSVEEDAKRPEDEDKQKELKKTETYGHYKLAGEEALMNQRENQFKYGYKGFPWVALRFSDVIGPRDTTERWLIYHLWIKFYHDIGMPIYVPPPVVDVTESLTYVMDAADAVVKVIEQRSNKEILDQAYNIGMDEEVSLWDIVQKIGGVMGTEDMEQNNIPSEKAFFLYPTVFAGPMDSSKAKRVLGWKPTDIDVAFKETIHWFDDLFVKNEKEREAMISSFVTYVVPREVKNRFYLAVDRELEKHGIVKEKYRKKKKGDIGEQDEMSQEDKDLLSGDGPNTKDEL